LPAPTNPQFFGYPYMAVDIGNSEHILGQIHG